MGGDKTEPATAKRRSDERKKGNVFMSNEIILLASLFATLFLLQALGEFIMGNLMNNFEFYWAEAANVISLGPGSLQDIFIRSAIVFGLCALPTLLAAGLVAVVGTMAQTRGLFATSKLKPDFKKMSPISGFKKMFSVRGLVELLKSIVKIIILAYVIYNQYMERFQTLPRLMEMEFGQALYFAADFMMDIVTSVSVIYIFLALADYMYQRWQYEKDLRMTKQEIKEEYKQTEGDPKIKGQIRQRQQEMSRSRMMQAVPEADVVITNPTHYAVAIRYEAGKNTAPVVLAKGADLMALRIKKVAEENGVVLVENKPVARGLYENVPLDREIPEKFFQPVAEILAFVYETSKKHKLPKVVQNAIRAQKPLS